jgi:GT2 family glycosyltransferase
MGAVLHGLSMVTVTYGDRWGFLSGLLRYAEDTDLVHEVVVVDNGTAGDLRSRVHDAGMTKAVVVRHEQNLGSAPGYRAGIAAALERGATWLWLLDDDNLPRPDALPALADVVGRMSAERSVAEVAFLAIRPDHQTGAGAPPLWRYHPRPGSYLGFHLLDVPNKVWRRCRSRSRPEPLPSSSSLVSVPFAPYSGLLLHRSLVDEIGLPRSDLVLYADDTEYSGRIPQTGGAIYLVPGACIDDLESSWNVCAHAASGSAVAAWLHGGSDLRVYYGVRNQVFLESREDRAWWRRLNRLAYLGLLGAMALGQGRLHRWRLVRTAAADGEAGRLGPHPDFPLP